MYKKQGFLPRLLLRIYLILFSAVVILPMIWTAYTSLKTNQEFFKDPWALPAVPHFQNYVTAWDTAKTWLSVKPPVRAEPRCPDVPKATRWPGSETSGIRSV